MITDNLHSAMHKQVDSDFWTAYMYLAMSLDAFLAASNKAIAFSQLDRDSSEFADPMETGRQVLC